MGKIYISKDFIYKKQSRNDSHYFGLWFSDIVSSGVNGTRTACRRCIRHTLPKFLFYSVFADAILFLLQSLLSNLQHWTTTQTIFGKLNGIALQELSGRDSEYKWINDLQTVWLNPIYYLWPNIFNYYINLVFINSFMHVNEIQKFLIHKKQQSIIWLALQRHLLMISLCPPKHLHSLLSRYHWI